eukprot:232854_1
MKRKRQEYDTTQPTKRQRNENVPNSGHSYHTFTPINTSNDQGSTTTHPPDSPLHKHDSIPNHDTTQPRNQQDRLQHQYLNKSDKPRTMIVSYNTQGKLRPTHTLYKDIIHDICSFQPDILMAQEPLGVEYIGYVEQSDSLYHDIGGLKCVTHDAYGRTGIWINTSIYTHYKQIDLHDLEWKDPTTGKDLEPINRIHSSAVAVQLR